MVSMSPLLFFISFMYTCFFSFFFFSSRRRHTRLTCDWSSDVCSSDLVGSDEALTEYRITRDHLAHQLGAQLAALLDPDQDEGPAAVLAGSVGLEGEIGRASCRERV